jgi:hypothetical protein
MAGKGQAQGKCERRCACSHRALCPPSWQLGCLPLPRQGPVRQTQRGKEGPDTDSRSGRRTSTHRSAWLSVAVHRVFHRSLPLLLLLSLRVRCCEPPSLRRAQRPLRRPALGWWRSSAHALTHTNRTRAIRTKRHRANKASTVACRLRLRASSPSRVPHCSLRACGICTWVR